MKRPLFLILILFLIAEPSIITFNPSSAKGKVGEILTFTVEVKYIHLPCLIGIDDAKFTYAKVSPLSVSGWESLGPGRFRKVLTVKLMEEGNGKIILNHICPIKKSTGEVQIKIAKRTLEETYQEAKQLLSDLLIGKDINLEYLRNTLKELIESSQGAKGKEIKRFLELVKEILSAIERIFALSQEAMLKSD